MSSDKKNQEYTDLAQRAIKIEAEIQELEAQLIDRKTLLDVIRNKMEKFQQLAEKGLLRLTTEEIQSGSNRQKWAEGLIEQLPRW